MTDFYDTAERKERVILVAVSLGEKQEGGEAAADISLDELEELAETAGAETVGG